MKIQIPNISSFIFSSWTLYFLKKVPWRETTAPSSGEGGFSLPWEVSSYFWRHPPQSRWFSIVLFSFIMRDFSFFHFTPFADFKKKKKNLLHKSRPSLPSPPPPVTTSNSTTLSPLSSNHWHLLFSIYLFLMLTYHLFTYSLSHYHFSPHFLFFSTELVIAHFANGTLLPYIFRCRF